MKTNELEGKIALVNGASRGIGLAIARGLAAAGATVVVTSRSMEGAAEAAASVEADGGKAVPLACHAGRLDEIEALFEAIRTDHGRLDVLVNNAATNPHFGPVLTAEESHWDKILDVNVKGYFHLVKACTPGMKARGGGKVINISSVAGLEPQPMMGVYSVSKAAVIMLTKVLAAELATDNIQVNAIAPGFVKTKFSSVLWQTEAINEAILRAIPQGRMAEPQEIAGLALYLASPASDFASGSIFVLDGGQLVGNRVNIF